MTSSPRSLALSALLDPRPGYVEDHLADRLASSGLALRDRALATEIVLGTVRRRGMLDAVLAAYSNRPLADVHPFVLSALRIGLYQVLFLTRVPRHAAVGESVEALKSVAMEHAAGFANGVLRALVRDLEREAAAGGATDPRRTLAAGNRTARFGRDVFPDPSVDLAGHLAAVHSHPRWLALRWLARLGRERAEDLLRAGNASLPVALRPHGRGPDDLARALREAGAGCRIDEASGAVLLDHGSGPVEDLPGYAEGRFMVQDPAQTRVGRALAPRPGETVLELAAAPGTKSCHLADLAPGVRIVAVDAGRGRLGRLLENVRRVGAQGIWPVAADALALPFPPDAAFPAVLLDAPCSNTAVLARRVEVRWRLEPERIQERAALQISLAREAALRVAPGGRLVYSTCSLESEENEEVVRGLIAGRPDLSLDAEELTCPSSTSGGGYWARVVREPARGRHP
ncbi:MAG: 16S rRNA (cytosine(967)-C(5))-methyltransferase RsmB [Planctomycetes bacterium]|nr:16S rRNA (cytosine(967)-C(5))-methyltransferase RsmB [Planctomycetota bacterium]